METQQSAKTAAYRSRSVILAIDVGSSSVRCTAYDAGAVVSADDSDRSDRDKSTDDPADSLEVLASSSQARRSVHPSTGQIALENDDGTTLLDIIDMLVDDVLRKLQEKCRTSSFQVIALGFSSLVMNLVGVDRNGKLIGDSASMSYACSSTAEVIAEVQDLKRYVRIFSSQSLSSLGQ
jgi:sugar (pentulose or hexulose) kinase